MQRTMTYDEAAVMILISGKPEKQIQRELSALCREIDVKVGKTCPECDSSDVVDNGCRGRDLGFCCLACGHQWDAEDC